jgi:hypothetical protein
MPPPSEGDVKGVEAASGASCITPFDSARPNRLVVSTRPVVFPLVPVASIAGSGDNLGDATQTCRAMRTPLRNVAPMREVGIGHSTYTTPTQCGGDSECPT